MAEANYYQDGCKLDITAAAALTAGQVVQLSDGRAGVTPIDYDSGDLAGIQVEGVYQVAKTASVVITDGQPVYWDHSANSATYTTANDRDFFLGVAVGDAASADTTMYVAINVRPRYLISLQDSPFLSVPVLTAGTVGLLPAGGARKMTFSATAEAQKIDLLSQGGFALASNWIVEGEFNVIDDGDAAAIDFNIGVANGTHASDADSITESCFLHLDGNALDLYAESDDGTTEVNATDTTVNIALGTKVHFVMDGRDPSDIQIYVNGALVLSGTTFTLAAATGPLKLLAHLEKSSDDTTADYYVNFLAVRIMEQD